MTSRAAVEAFLSEPAIAVVGASRSGHKFGNAAVRTLRRKGYRVYALHRSAEAIDGERCYRRFADLPEPVHAALVVVPPAEAIDVVRDAAAAGITRVWLQQGAESDAVLAACKAVGVEVISGECVLMFAHPNGIHRIHHWIQGLRGKLPA
jgi:predicted CoA-binding protein